MFETTNQTQIHHFSGEFQGDTQLQPSQINALRGRWVFSLNFRSHSNEGVLDTSRRGPKEDSQLSHICCVHPRNRYRNRQDLVFFRFCCAGGRRDGRQAQGDGHSIPDQVGETTGEKRPETRERQAQRGGHGIQDKTRHKALRSPAVNCSGKKYGPMAIKSLNIDHLLVVISLWYYLPKVTPKVFSLTCSFQGFLGTRTWCKPICAIGSKLQLFPYRG